MMGGGGAGGSEEYEKDWVKIRVRKCPPEDDHENVYSPLKWLYRPNQNSICILTHSLESPVHLPSAVLLCSASSRFEAVDYYYACPFPTPMPARGSRDQHDCFSTRKMKYDARRVPSRTTLPSL